MKQNIGIPMGTDLDQTLQNYSFFFMNLIS